MNECVFIYRTYHIVSQGGLQFYLSEIGRQLVEAPLAAAISPYLINSLLITDLQTKIILFYSAGIEV